jgi:chromosome segregation protein
MVSARDAEREQTKVLNALRARHQEAQGKLVSTEALQQAALGKSSGKVAEWLKSKSLHLMPRVAQQLRVEKGWERAVETVLGSYLEAVCVDGLESITALLPSFQCGHLAVVNTWENGAVQTGAVPTGAGGPSLLARIQGTTVLASILAPVLTAESLDEALRIQARLGAGESVVTRDGIWLGAEWLRVSRDADAHAGVIEREEVLRDIRNQVVDLAEELRQHEQRLELTRERLRDHEDRRDRLQSEVNRLHREHVDRKAEHDAAQSRRAEAQRRLTQLETEHGDVTSDLRNSEADLRAACAHGSRDRCIGGARAAAGRTGAVARAHARRAGRGESRRIEGSTACTGAGLAGRVEAVLARRAEHDAVAHRGTATRARAASP